MAVLTLALLVLDQPLMRQQLKAILRGVFSSTWGIEDMSTLQLCVKSILIYSADTTITIIYMQAAGVRCACGALVLAAAGIIVMQPVSTHRFCVLLFGIRGVLFGLPEILMSLQLYHKEYTVSSVTSSSSSFLCLFRLFSLRELELFSRPAQPREVFGSAAVPAYTFLQ